MCAASGVTSPTTNASSVATNRAAPVQRFQLEAVNQTNQTAAARKRMRNEGGSQRARVPLRETSRTRPSCTSSAIRHPKTQLDLADAIGADGRAAAAATDSRRVRWPRPAPTGREQQAREAFQ